MLFFHPQELTTSLGNIEGPVSMEGKKNDSEEVLFNKQKFLNTSPPVINIY